MKKLLAPAIVLSLVVLSGSPALAANKVGDSCKVAGRVVTTSVQKLVCAKVAKNLKWVALTAPAVTTTIAPTTTVAATTTTIAAVKPVVTLLRAGARRHLRQSTTRLQATKTSIAQHCRPRLVLILRPNTFRRLIQLFRLQQRFVPSMLNRVPREIIRLTTLF